jgi:hypothetical protein
VTDRPVPCEEARGLLDERLDRPLDEAEEGALLLHLAGCASCREEAVALESVHASLSGMEPADPGAAFTDRVVAALDRAPGGGPGVGRGGGAVPAPAGIRLLRGLVAAAGTTAFVALAVAVFPIDAAASTMGGLVPEIPVPGILAPALPALPAAAADLFAGLPGLVPPWAAALGALLAAAAAAVPVAALRRAGRRP